MIAAGRNAMITPTAKRRASASPGTATAIRHRRVK